MSMKWTDRGDEEKKTWVDEFQRRMKNQTDCTLYLTEFKDDEFP